MREKIEATVDEFLTACKFAGETKTNLLTTFMGRVDAYAQREGGLALLQAAEAVYADHPLVSLRLASMANQYVEKDRETLNREHEESLARARTDLMEQAGQLRLL